MCILGGENPAVDIPQLRMVHGCAHQPAAITPALMFLQHDHIAEHGPAGVVGYDAAKADHVAIDVKPERQRSSDLAFDLWECDSLSPVGCAEEPVNHRKFDPAALG